MEKYSRGQWIWLELERALTRARWPGLKFELTVHKSKPDSKPVLSPYYITGLTGLTRAQKLRPVPTLIVAQLVEWPPTKSEICGSNLLDITYFYFLSIALKRRKQRKRGN